MAKPIPTTKPTRKPKNNTKHQRGDKNGLKLTEPLETTIHYTNRKQTYNPEPAGRKHTFTRQPYKQDNQKDIQQHNLD
jgi:hypothetical protein